MKRFAVILAMLFAVLQLEAQTTKVSGSVHDAETGEPIPFAGIYFKDTAIGLTADIEGRFTIQTRDPNAKVLVCQLLGYETEEQTIKHGAFSQVEFRLKLSDNELPGAFVKADNRRIRRLLANIDAHRINNDPDQRPFYQCNVYNKMELDLSHPREVLSGKTFNREFGFVFDYMDTSVVSGVPYLPVLFSESVAHRKHSSNPTIDNEVITANHISGINPDENMLSQFSGSMRVLVNFYRPFINVFDVEFPSPIQRNGLLFYNYFVIDSLKMDGRKTYHVRYHPKPGISSPAFDGEMYIDAEEYALKHVTAKMVRGGNVNWLRDIVLESEYQRLADSTWFFSQDNLYADFSVALRDSSKLMSFIGTRQLNYRDLDFSEMEPLDPGDGKVKVEPDANHKDESYWEAERPIELTDKEQGVYDMVDRFQKVDLYKIIYKVGYTLATSYYDIGPIGIGIGQIYSHNALEGHKPRIGIHTSRALSKTFRASGAISYGFADKQVKGFLTYEHLFSRDPERKLTLDARYDVFQLGKGQSNLTSDNFLTSVWGGESKLAPLSNFSARYQHEFSMNFNLDAQIGLQRYYSNAFVPIFDWSGNEHTVAVNQIKVQGRFSWDETVNRGFYRKTYLHTLYPVVNLSLEGSIPGLRKDDVGFIRPQLELAWKFRIPPIGISDISLNTGTIIGQVPWTLLQLYPGNATNILDKTAFSCMEYFEFGSDTWATLFWYHCFNGFFLGKIPLIRELQLREEFTAKLAYGTLRDWNNGTDPSYGALTAFPQWPGQRQMTTLDGVPYVELGAGVSNIFRVLRVDFIWRVTHREVAKINADGTQAFNTDGSPVMVPARRLWTINVGAEFRF